MLRRTLLATTLALLAAPALAQTPAPIRTRWVVKSSEGLDAIAILGPLSGKPFYVRHYEAAMAAFKPRLPAAAMEALMSLHAESDAAGALLWPNLTLVFSGGPTATLGDLLASLEAAETVLKPPFQASVYWDIADWNRFLAGRDRLRAVLTEAVQRATRLLSLLRGKKKEQKALTGVWASLKALALDREGGR